MPTQTDRQLPGQVAIYATVGDDIFRTFRFEDANSDPIDLTGETIQCVVHPADDGDETTFDNLSSAGDLTAGLIKVKFSRTLTAALGAGRHRWCLKRTNTSDKKRTNLSGPLVLEDC